MRVFRSATVLTALLTVGVVAGCADDGDAADPGASADPTPTAEATTEAPAEPPTLSGPVDPLQFMMKTADGAVDLDGTASSCDSADEENLAVSFTDGDATVDIDVADGAGTVTVTGGPEFEGTADMFEIGDDGTVNITGTGSAADDSATATAFTVLGGCTGGDAGGSGDAGGDAAGDSAAGDVTLTTANGSADVSGAATTCTNPDEADLDLEFSDGTSTVMVDVAGGTGSVEVTGGSEFEGTVEMFEIGDDGSFTASGFGGAADPGAEATTFEIAGTCAG
ncbi:hypothetical protein GCM10025865_06130 [Paraoerskovia sediminicola]|uniref:DUF5666 domain-containing protein n=1 Tax=Paraoerskovia sediminicola TaxID=1138587 RepID=A0ABM8FZX2_9CELL|nr:hypothetical protein [Paraoerskovia sediminicola]BDZ41314.1 hypothetical protein GCM10025865_06130 [Paraoerskovia sediminicola]